MEGDFWGRLRDGERFLGDAGEWREVLGGCWGMEGGFGGKLGDEVVLRP